MTTPIVSRVCTFGAATLGTLFFLSLGIHRAYQDDDCADPICKEAGDSQKHMKDLLQAMQNSSSPSKENGLSNKQSVRSVGRFLPPAPDKNMLGRQTWALLHCQAAYYAEKPTEEEKENMKTYLHALSLTYPCKVCAQDLQYLLKKMPPRLDSREEFEQWMCDMHNEVNRQLGKPIFDCRNARQRWHLSPEKFNPMMYDEQYEEEEEEDDEEFS
jgi:hypothetical protein